MSDQRQSRHHSANTQKPIHESSMHYCIIPSPVGHLLLAGNRQALQILSFQDGKNPEVPNPDWIEDRKPFADVIHQLAEYFSGVRRTFHLHLRLQGTPFQRRVWQALTTIPYGSTVSYGAIARAIGQPTASRAVGAANGKNPLSIIVPCHRVIGHSGKLIGYGGGLPIKETLLNLEHHVVSQGSLTNP